MYKITIEGGEFKKPEVYHFEVFSLEIQVYHPTNKQLDIQKRMTIRAWSGIEKYNDFERE